MKKNLYDRTVEELRMSIENIWEKINVQPKRDMPPIVIPVTVEMLSELTDRTVIRTLDALSHLLARFGEIPSLSRSSAAKMLKKHQDLTGMGRERYACTGIYRRQSILPP